MNQLDSNLLCQPINRLDHIEFEEFEIIADQFDELKAVVGSVELKGHLKIF